MLHVLGTARRGSGPVHTKVGLQSSRTQRKHTTVAFTSAQTTKVTFTPGTQTQVVHGASRHACRAPLRQVICMLTAMEKPTLMPSPAPPKCVSTHRGTTCRDISFNGSVCIQRIHTSAARRWHTSKLPRATASIEPIVPARTPCDRGELELKRACTPTLRQGMTATRHASPACQLHCMGHMHALSTAAKNVQLLICYSGNGSPADSDLAPLICTPVIHMHYSRWFQ